ncbi:MAG TPA: S1 RNA-binding domain-containing protein [Patescibacteria group bacterium]
MPTKNKQTANNRSSTALTSKVTKDQSGKKAQTMDDLIKSNSTAGVFSLKRGQQVTGKIVSISNDLMLVDIGSKSEGLIYGKEMAAASDIVKKLKAGDNLTATVVYPENDAGQTILSLRKTGSESRWQDLIDVRDDGSEIEVKALEVSRGGLIADYLGIRGFIPSTQLDLEFLKNPQNLIGKSFKVRVVEVDKNLNRLILTQRSTVSPEEADKILSKVSIGTNYKGKVVAVLPSSIFVNIEANGDLIEGIIHISEVSWEKVADLQGMFNVEDEIEAQAVGLDKESARVFLSLKQLKDDPWQTSVKNYSKEQVVTGNVAKITNFGAFIELEKGIEGLIHVSKIPAEKTLKVGEKVTCTIEEIDLSNKRIALSLMLAEKPVMYR